MADYSDYVQMSGSGDFRLYLDVDVLSQNIGDNTSSIRWTLRARDVASINATWGGYATSWNSNVGGSSSGSKASFDFRDADYETIATGTRTISHASNGTKSFTATGYWNSAHSSVGSGTVSYGITLPTIPRATQPSTDQPKDAGQILTISLPRADSGFTHNLTYTFGGASGTIATGVGTSYAWTVPTALLNEIPNATTGTGTITAVTKDGSTTIGTKSVAFRVNAASTVVPTFTAVTHSDANTSVASIVGAYVQSLSRYSMAITGAAGAGGSTISSYLLTANGLSFPTATATMATPISTFGSVPIVGKITDSRGRTATQTVTPTVLAYTPPQITSMTVLRSNSSGTAQADGTYIRVNLNVAVQSLINTTERNELTFKIETRPTGGTFATKGTWTGGLTFNSFKTVGTGGEYSIGASYEVRLTVSDKFNNTIASRTVATAAVPFDVSATGTGHGKVHQQGSVDAVGEIYHRDGALVEPVGVMHMWPTNTAPTGYLICDGAAVSRTTYAALFTVISTTYGTGDGSTTFNLPNFKGRAPVGRDSGQTEFDVLGEAGGAKTHTHPLSADGSAMIGMGNPNSNARIYMASANDLTAYTPDSYAVVTTVSNAGGPGGTTSRRTALSGNTDAGSTLSPYRVTNFIIKAK